MAARLPEVCTGAALRGPHDRRPRGSASVSPVAWCSRRVGRHHGKQMHRTAYSPLARAPPDPCRKTRACSIDHTAPSWLRLRSALAAGWCGSAPRMYCTRGGTADPGCHNYGVSTRVRERAPPHNRLWQEACTAHGSNTRAHNTAAGTQLGRCTRPRCLRVCARPPRMWPAVYTDLPVLSYLRMSCTVLVLYAMPAAPTRLSKGEPSSLPNTQPWLPATPPKP